MNLYRVTRQDGSIFMVEATSDLEANLKALRTNGNKSPVILVEQVQ